MIGYPKSAPPAGVETGMRRVTWVRVVIDDEGPHCDVVGVGHRLPAVHHVSLATATALAASGVPITVRTAR